MQADDHGAPSGANWAKPLVRLDSAWQLLEARLCAAVLVAEMGVLSLWILLRGMATDYFPGQNAAGLFCRLLVGIAVLGGIGHLVTRTRGVAIHRAGVIAGLLLGPIAGRLLAHAGVGWSSNFLNWLNSSSVFMLIGGLRGMATRLTFWVAFLGASLATSRAKHIHVDVLLRYVPVRLRVPSAAIGWLAAALVSFFAMCGFVDYIAIAAYQASATEPCPADASKVCDTPVSEKLAVVAKETSADAFVLLRQASLDVQSLPHVLAGVPYDSWMTARQWNDWLDGADWGSHFDPAAINTQKMDTGVPGAVHAPAVEVPGGEARGLLVRELDFVFPLGFFMIGLKFLLRVVLLLSGNVRLDIDAELSEEDLLKANARDEAAASEA